MTTDRETFDTIRTLTTQCVAQTTIARELGIDRFVVQTVRRIQALPVYIQNAFLANNLTQTDIGALDRARRDGNLAEVWARIRSGETIDLYPKIRTAKVTRAIQTTRNPIVRETLRWVLGQCDRLPS